MGKQSMHAPVRSAGVVGTARRKGGSGNRGISGENGVGDPDVVAGRRFQRKSDRVVRPSRPGNAGGGKDPDLWCAFDDGEEGAIDDESRKARKDQEPSEKALL